MFIIIIIHVKNQKKIKPKRKSFSLILLLLCQTTLLFFLYDMNSWMACSHTMLPLQRSLYEYSTVSSPFFWIFLYCILDRAFWKPLLVGTYYLSKSDTSTVIGYWLEHHTVLYGTVFEKKIGSRVLQRLLELQQGFLIVRKI